MNNQSYGWIQQRTSESLQRPPSTQVIEADVQDATSMEEEQLLENGDDDDAGDAAYLLEEGEPEADLDHIAAENLIFMARDGQMVSEIIDAGGDIEHGGVVVSHTGGTAMELQHAAALVSDNEAYAVVFTEDAQQMVTEEVITDDWVQHQGEERVEISAEQIIGSGNSQMLLEMEEPLRVIQDEYIAVRPYPCDFCSRRFRKKSSLMNHMVAHKNDRPLLCKLCDARFSRRAELLNHLKAHADVNDADGGEVDDCEELAQFGTESRSVNDHYYDQVWNFQSAPAITQSQPEISRHRQRVSRQLQDHSTSGNSSSTSTNTTPRGRISRLKPKEELQCVVNDRKTNSELGYIDCQHLQESTAAVKFKQDNSAALHRQYPVIDDSKPFVCQQCGLAFAREKALLSHVKNHRIDAPYECNQCNEMFWDTNSLQEHQKSHQFEESNSEYDPDEADDTQTESESEQQPQQQLYGEFYCAECGISFHRQDLLRRHVKQHVRHEQDGRDSLDNSFKNSTQSQPKDAQHCCNTCGETFAEALDLLAHAEIHARYPPFKCVLCGETFYKEQTIKRHLEGKHANEMTANSCILCGKECRDRKALIKHAWDHSREKCHSCSKCGKNFHNKARLKRHMASHRDKSVICDVCHEEFPDGRTLSNHRHSHSATSSGKLFPCHECGKTFGSRSSQQIHVRIHTGERPYGCRFCWKAFADGGTLRKHERIHTGEKPYACSVCPRAFNQRVVLREHIRSHHSGLDASRGIYFCTVCSAELRTSNELIQHLIQHSDMNTAKQRQPIMGPRKYKRRRKLQPHEIANMRSESQQEGNDGSDIDISDFDMDNVDDLLGITGPASNSATKCKKGESTVAKRRSKNTSRTDRALPTRLKYEPEDDDDNNDNDNSDNDDDDNDDDDDDDDDENEDVQVGDDLMSTNIVHNNNNQQHNKKHRYDSLSSNSDKLWQTKLLQSSNSANEDSYKTLFNNLEHGLQSIETLVINTSPKPVRATRTKQNKSAIGAGNNGAQRTQEVQLNKLDQASSLRSNNVKGTTARTRRTRASKATKASSTRPRMIHTEKWRLSESEQPQKRTRGRTYITRTDTSNLELLSASKPTSTIVDDYEIISPATHPPNQISSSPLHIKQENDHNHHHLNHLTNNHHHHNHHHHHHQTQQIYDAQLLLDASNLRKEAYDKFNPNIVNDLEEILRSPLKLEKNGRQRFTSVSSVTQFLADTDQHSIKIEPSSPDLRDIVESRHTTTSSSSARTARNRQTTANYKYALDAVGPVVSPTSLPSKSTRHPKLNAGKAQQQQQLQKNNNSSISNSSRMAAAVTDAAKTPSSSTSVPTTSSYFNFGVDSFKITTVVPANPSCTDVGSNYFSISAVVSADDATEVAAAEAAEAASAAAAAAASAKASTSVQSERKQRYFECEMCSAVFPDRAQLLEHVHIHI